MWIKADRVNLAEVKDLPPIQYREINGLKVSYRDYGSGPVVFCLPPWPFSSLAFLPLGLAVGKHLRLICPEMPGWGGYTPKTGASPTLNNYGHYLSEFINSFGIEHYSLIGYSYGGLFCQWLTEHNKATPQKVALVSTLHDGRGLAHAFRNRLLAYKLARKVHIPNFLIKLIAATVIKMDYSYNEEIHQMWKYPLLTQGKQEVLRCDISTVMDSVMVLTHAEVIHNRNFPTQSIVIYADHDLPSLREESKDMARSLGIEPLVLEQTGHDHLVFDVNKSADILLNFLLA